MELQPYDKTSTELAQCGYGKASLTIPPDLSEEGFTCLAQSISHMRGSIHWWIGDALVFADQKFGELAAQYQDLFGLNYQQLADYKWVASRIPPDIREEPDVLPWSHHRDIAKLEDKEEQKHWIQLAAAERLTRTDLRARMEEAGVLKKKQKDVSPTAEKVVPPTVEAAPYEIPVTHPEESVEEMTDTICTKLDQLFELRTNEAEMALYQIQSTVDTLIAKREKESNTIEVVAE